MIEQPTPQDIRTLRDLRTQLRDRYPHLAPACRVHHDAHGLGLDLELTTKRSITIMCRHNEWFWITRHHGPAGTATSDPTEFIPTNTHLNAAIELVITELNDYIRDLLSYGPEHEDLDEAFAKLQRLAIPRVS